MFFRDICHIIKKDLPSFGNLEGLAPKNRNFLSRFFPSRCRYIVKGMNKSVEVFGGVIHVRCYPNPFDVFPLNTRSMNLEFVIKLPVQFRRFKPVSYTHLDVYKRQAKDNIK